MIFNSSKMIFKLLNFGVCHGDYGAVNHQNYAGCTDRETID